MTATEAGVPVSMERRYRDAMAENLRLRTALTDAARRLDKAEQTLLQREHLAGEVLGVAAMCRVALEAGR